MPCFLVGAAFFSAPGSPHIWQQCYLFLSFFFSKQRAWIIFLISSCTGECSDQRNHIFLKLWTIFLFRHKHSIFLFCSPSLSLVILIFWLLKKCVNICLSFCVRDNIMTSVSLMSQFKRAIDNYDWCCSGVAFSECGMEIFYLATTAICHTTKEILLFV